MYHHDIPRPEHPRPDLRRSRWQTLNGVWEFRADPEAAGEAERWYAPEAGGFADRIVVPFPWQSARSGLGWADYRGVAWYRRRFAVPAEWRQRVVLHFGAVDYAARVWVNGQLAGEHEGGYLPFAFDITDLLSAGENVLTVRVDDPADLHEIPHGKQRNMPPDPWDDCAFTPSSGIWQTVWLEERPAAHITSVRITPDVAAGRALASVAVHGSGAATLIAAIRSPTGDRWDVQADVTLDAGTMALELPVPEPQLWDVDSPQLYEVELTLVSEAGQDQVTTYFGMRTVTIAGGQIWLNGRPIYLRSALDQGFWPESLHTPPGDAAIIADIRYAKALGLNMLRKHIKVEDPRFAYWCDRLGMLLWCDTPCPTRFTPQAQQRLADTLTGMIARDYNHPSIIIWCIYNESWGLEFRLGQDATMQQWVSQLYAQVKALDPTRLVVDNSGWQHVKTDIVDFHAYTDDPTAWRAICTTLAERPDDATVLGYRLFADGCCWRGEPLMMSEYGPGWRDDRSWGFRSQTLELRRYPSIIGYTYTELYDIEHEYAGFACYDRTPKVFGYDIAEVNAADVLILDDQVERRLTAGQVLEVPVSASLYGDAPAGAFTLAWRLITCPPGGLEVEVLAHGTRAVTAAQYAVSALGTMTITIPDAAGPAQLVAELLDLHGRVRARASLDLALVGSAASASQAAYASATQVTVLCPAGRPAVLDWGGAETRDALAGPSVFCAPGSGRVSYWARLPSGLPSVSGLRVRCEAGSYPPERWQSVVGHGIPSELDILLNGIPIGRVLLPGLHVHAGGALSRIFELGPGQHGEWFDLHVPGALVPHILAAARANGRLELTFQIRADALYANGLSLFGRYSGRYGRDPEVVLELNDDGASAHGEATSDA